MMRILVWFYSLLWITVNAQSALSQALNALARLEPGSSIVDTDGGVTATLNLSQPVPYRIAHLSDPFRVVIDFNEVEWVSDIVGQLDRAETVADLRAGIIAPGWSRLVLIFSQPTAVQTAEMTTTSENRATLRVELRPVTSEQYAEKTRLASNRTSLFTPNSQAEPPQRRDPLQPLKVVIDPGHGGIDPGAQIDGDVESHLMLAFARELKERLIRAGGFDVTLTREADEFVSLEARVSKAHAVRAHVFLSLHADVISQGSAKGATIYTLSDDASDIASRKLAERHDRADLLSGVDLSQQDDQIAFVLMDMARTDTAHRAEKLAEALVAGLEKRVELFKKPRLSAGFSVLKAPDIPSVLLELGFMSSSYDLQNLRNPDWRQRAQQGIVAALTAWGPCRSGRGSSQAQIASARRCILP